MEEEEFERLNGFARAPYMAAEALYDGVFETWYLFHIGGREGGRGMGGLVEQKSEEIQKLKGNGRN